ncbi:sensor histidine kinase [Sphingosinicella soli]|uniref:Signal transduction histidine kinase n=1 Tax=Sphingosinicella soli TaxID=333708 RepID=A0A7W7F833_9SPHN|nr:histidine kinase [Sphingosinicella soli]MBB4633262.1 signal transduction histidine kinase [Sphingosinicella soli]
MNRSLLRGALAEDSARTAVQSIFGFWIFYFLVVTLRALALGFDDMIALAGRRSVVTIIGMTISWALYLALAPLEKAPVRKRALMMFLLCVPAAALFTTFNFYTFYVYEPLPLVAEDLAHKDRSLAMLLAIIFEGTVTWFFFFAAWAAFHLALGYAADAAHAERRAAAFREEAQAAQLRALRYQINPHFLFNTLNSLSSLVLTNRNEEAERMILNLATFFRASLTSDPTEDIPLADELEQQRLYLEVERARFGDRLEFAFDIDPDAARQRVPSLILQPLVENAVKYAVSPSNAPVCIRVKASLHDAMLHIVVEDDGAFAASQAHVDGTGTGLNNVRDRLRARFGDAAAFKAGPWPGGGFRIDIAIPVKRALPRPVSRYD